MYTSVIIPTVAANLTATGCALLLLRRGPSRRLRLLTLTVGLLSLSQTTSLFHSQDPWDDGRQHTFQIQQSLAACLSLLAIYLLGMEIYDRNCTDKRLRLAEHEAMLPRTAESNSTPTESGVPDPRWIQEGACKQSAPSSDPTATAALLGPIQILPDLPVASTAHSVGETALICSDLREDLLATLNRITADQIAEVGTIRGQRVVAGLEARLQ